MTLRITLIDDPPDQAPAPQPAAVSNRGAQPASGPASADWDDRAAPPLLLYLADEPELGREFEYGGARWEIVDYQDGWVARLVVSP